jgi:hypothetical protein
LHDDDDDDYDYEKDEDNYDDDDNDSKGNDDDSSCIISKCNMKYGDRINIFCNYYYYSSLSS